MLQLNFGIWIRDGLSESMTKRLLLPRLLWIRTDSTMQDLHKFVFKHLRFCFAEWIDWTDPDTTRVPKEGVADLRKMIPFPYTAEDGSRITKAHFN